MNEQDWLLRAREEQARRMAEMLAPCAAPLAAQDLTMQSTVPFVLTEADLIFLKVNRISPE